MNLNDVYYDECSANIVAEQGNQEQEIKYKQDYFECIKKTFAQLNISYKHSNCVFVISIKDKLNDIFCDEIVSIFKEVLVSKGVFDATIVNAEKEFKGYNEEFKNKLSQTCSEFMDYLSYSVKREKYETGETYGTGKFTGRLDLDNGKLDLKEETNTIWTKHVEYYVVASNVSRHIYFEINCYAIFEENEYKSIISEIGDFDLMPSRREFGKAKLLSDMGEENYIQNIKEITNGKKRRVNITFIFVAISICFALASAILNGLTMYPNANELYPWTNGVGIIVYSVNVLNVILCIVVSRLLKSIYNSSRFYFYTFAPSIQICCKLFYIFTNFLKDVTAVLGAIIGIIAVILCIIGWFACVALIGFAVYLLIRVFIDSKKEKIYYTKAEKKELKLIEKLKKILASGQLEVLMEQREKILKLIKEKNKLSLY